MNHMSILDLFGGGKKFAEGLARARNTENAVILDVRTTEEYRGGHVPGSINVPLDRLESTEFDKETPLFVYCLSGARSSRACAYLGNQGIRAENIGGINSYRGEMER